MDTEGRYRVAKLKKRADGRYQRRITLSDGRSKLVYGKSLAALNEAEEAVRAEDRSGLVVGDHTLVGEWAKVWIETYKSGLRPNTVRMYRDTYNLHIRPFLGSMELQAVRPVHVMSVMASVSGSSESQQKKVLLTMRQIFAEARRNRLMNIDPTEGVKITPHATEKKKEYLSMPELKTFIKALSALEEMCIRDSLYPIWNWVSSTPLFLYGSRYAWPSGVLGLSLIHISIRRTALQLCQNAVQLSSVHLCGYL